MIPAIEAISAFRTALWAANPRRTRAEFDHWQARALQRWLTRDVPRVRAYSSGAVPDLYALPLTDKATLMADFAAYNRPRITADQVRAAMADDCRIGAFTVGASTGTSGNRGLFVISNRERFRWLGAILAKAMPDLLWRRRRVAILLPQATPLYDSARRTGRIALRFFALTVGIDAITRDLCRFDPDVIVAPPKVLRHLAQAGAALQPVRVFSAAETLDPVDRPIIEAHFGAPLEQIYMATEGLLGVTCRLGRMHLAEDSTHFEFDPVGDGLVSPRITSFRRETQIVARYQMNDLLRLSDAPCPCGSVLQAVDEIVGRMDDCFHLATDTRSVMMTPDVLRNAVVTAHQAIRDFRLIQTGAAQVALRLPKDLHDSAEQAAVNALGRLFHAQGLVVEITCQRADLALDTQRKLRRVENRFGAGGAAT